MKNGLLICSPRTKVKNIGDYIQSLAQEQFYDHIDCYVEREKLSLFRSNEKTKVIMNAWFMWEPEHFPPSDDVEPLFISFHLVPQIAESFFTPKTIEYLKKYEPIGARDKGTLKLLESYGIKAYFSGCLTLTLGLKYSSSQKENTFYFVDPYYETAGSRITLKNVSAYFRTLRNYLRYRKVVKRVIPHFVNEYRTIFGFISKKLETQLCAVDFYSYYHALFSDELLHKACYIKHLIDVDDQTDNTMLLNQARDFMNRYAKAKLVVTSRIHCALPCLGVQTPTIFISSDVLDGGKLRSAGRMGGLKELFHVVQWNKEGLRSQSTTLSELLKKGKIDVDVRFDNPNSYISLRDSMINKVTSFINK